MAATLKSFMSSPYLSILRA